MPLNRRRIKLGVPGAEFFERRVGAYGRFGCATRILVEYFTRHPELAPALQDPRARRHPDFMVLSDRLVEIFLEPAR